MHQRKPTPSSESFKSIHINRHSPSELLVNLIIATRTPAVVGSCGTITFNITLAHAKLTDYFVFFLYNNCFTFFTLELTTTTITSKLDYLTGMLTIELEISLFENFHRTFCLYSFTLKSIHFLLNVNRNKKTTVPGVKPYN